jgi:hypothetical protein
LVDEEWSAARTYSTIQSPVKVNGSGFGKIRNSDGKFLVCNLFCSNLPRMLGILVFQPRHRRLGINTSKENPVVGTTKFHMQPGFRRIVAPGSQRTVDGSGFDQFESRRGGAEMKKRNPSTPVRSQPGVELRGREQSAAYHGSKTPGFFHFRSPEFLEKLGPASDYEELPRF